MKTGISHLAVMLAALGNGGSLLEPRGGPFSIGVHAGAPHDPERLAKAQEKQRGKKARREAEAVARNLKKGTP